MPFYCPTAHHWPRGLLVGMPSFHVKGHVFNSQYYPFFHLIFRAGREWYISEWSTTPLVNASPCKDIKMQVNTSAYFNNEAALNKSMRRAEILSEAGILKGKERLVSLLFIFSLSLLVGKAPSNIHFKAVPGYSNIGIAYQIQTYMHFHCKTIACSCGHHPFPFIPVNNFVCAVGGLSVKRYKKVTLVAI